MFWTGIMFVSFHSNSSLFIPSNEVEWFSSLFPSLHLIITWLFFGGNCACARNHNNHIWNIWIWKHQSKWNGQNQKDMECAQLSIDIDRDRDRMLSNVIQKRTWDSFNSTISMIFLFSVSFDIFACDSYLSLNEIIVNVNELMACWVKMITNTGWRNEIELVPKQSRNIQVIATEKINRGKH